MEKHVACWAERSSGCCTTLERSTTTSPVSGQIHQLKAFIQVTTLQWISYVVLHDKGLCSFRFPGQEQRLVEQEPEGSEMEWSDEWIIPPPPSPSVEEDGGLPALITCLFLVKVMCQSDNGITSQCFRREEIYDHKRPEMVMSVFCCISSTLDLSDLKPKGLCSLTVTMKTLMTKSFRYYNPLCCPPISSTGCHTVQKQPDETNGDADVEGTVLCALHQTQWRQAAKYSLHMSYSGYFSITLYDMSLRIIYRERTHTL